MKIRVFFNKSIQEAEIFDKEFITLKSKEKLGIEPSFSNSQTKDMTFFGYVVFFMLYSMNLSIVYSYLVEKFGMNVGYFYGFVIVLFLIFFYRLIIFWVAKIYYQIYFYLIDKYPKFFHKQKEDFFYDLYLAGTQTIENLKLYQNSINQSKTGIIDKNFGKSFENSINGIYKIFSLIKSNPQFFSQNPKFLNFLKNLINEILKNYSLAFESIESLLQKESRKVDLLKNAGQGKLVNILSGEILQKQKNDFCYIKNRLESLKI